MLIERLQDERGTILRKYAELIERNDGKLGYMGCRRETNTVFEPKTADLFRCIKPFFFLFG